jgi:uncharacterized membrane protein YraQ (UPF0718 family)
MHVWIHNHALWEIGLVMVLLSVLLSWAGLYAFSRTVALAVRREHNDVAGFVSALVGVVFAVLLAFVAVATWERFDAGDRLAETEADLVASLYRDSATVEAPMGPEIRQRLSDYLDTVIEREWPAQQAGHAPRPEPSETLTRLDHAIEAVDPKTLGQADVDAALLRDLNQFYAARRARLIAADTGIPNEIWAILVIGSFITVAISYFFGMHSVRMHYALTGTLAASLALVLVLILALDWPFQGEVSIGSEAYAAVRDQIKQASQQSKL